MGIIRACREVFRKYKKLSTPVMILHITGKALAGMGLGILLVWIFPAYRWGAVGLILLLVGVLIQMPAAWRVFRK